MAVPLESRLSKLESRQDGLEEKHENLDDRVQRMETSIESLRTDIAAGREETRGDMKNIQDALMGVQRSAWESVPKWAADAANEQAERLRTANRSLGIMIGAVISLLGIVGVLMATIAVHML